MVAQSEISPDFPFKPNHLALYDSTIHYIDEGAGDPILFLHGNPTWSYLWRNVIPHLSALGRCIAPDLIGMGRSGKPDLEYRFFDHVKYLEGFIERLGLSNVTLVIHDWGGVLGFHYAMRHPGNIKGVAFMETFLKPMPRMEELPQPLREFFQVVKSPGSYDRLMQPGMLEFVLANNFARPLSAEEQGYYLEPYARPGSRKPVWRWTQEVPIGGDPADIQAVFGDFSQRLQQSDLPKLLLYSTPGYLVGEPEVAWCKQTIKNLATVDLGPGGHYLPEENPHRIGEALAQWYRSL
jgi:haloalkane dehalogenase